MLTGIKDAKWRNMKRKKKEIKKIPLRQKGLEKSKRRESRGGRGPKWLRPEAYVVFWWERKGGETCRLVGKERQKSTQEI